MQLLIFFVSRITFPKNHSWFKASIEADVAKISFENLPTGSYAAIVYHHENDNGTLDHKLAFPSEPMGFTNNWNLSLFSGMPIFKKLRFEHSGKHGLRLN